MHFAVLAPAESWYFGDLTRAAGSRHVLSATSYKHLAARMHGEGARITSSGIDLGNVDGVLVRSMPAGSLEQVVFRMDALARLESAGSAVLNPPKAIETAVDKYLATARLQAAGLLVPPTIACQTTEEALAGFHELGGDVVVKPLFGGEGRGIIRVSDEGGARRVFQTLEMQERVFYLQTFVPHLGRDWRLLVLGDAVLGMQRVNPDDWRTNISRGAKAVPLTVTSELTELALRAARAVGAPLAGVDLLPGQDGRLYALEVNAVPGWRALAPTTGVDVAMLVLQLLQRMAS